MTAQEIIAKYPNHILGNRERNGYHDSDFFITVWDETTKMPAEIMTGTTRGPQCATNIYGCFPVNASAEVKEAFNTYRRSQRNASALSSKYFSLVGVDSIGKRVIVKRGRKVPKGTEGVVFWQDTDKYQSNRYATAYRIGFKDDEGNTFWTSVSNVDVVVDMDAFEAEVKQLNVQPNHISDCVEIFKQQGALRLYSNTFGTKY